ncbi:MAG TPA: hypothetical protein VL131_07730 [Gammaproteobacteria bacterium]|nr:hypothetical protein [Gammaproteobacteria bacterium]
MTLSTRWLAPIGLGVALLAAAAWTSGQDNAAQTGAAAPGSPPNDEAAAGSAAADNAASESSAKAAARADDPDRTPVDCVIVTNIRQTAVIDDQTILFYMRGGKKTVYRNYLPNQCPRLAIEGRFAYEVKINRLCNIDLITVIENFGTRLGPGFTCRLGEFYPIPYEEAEILRKEKDHPDGPRGDSIKAKPAEVAPEKTGAAAAPASQGDAAR